MEKLKGREIAYILGTSESLSETPWNNKNADYLACWPVLTQPCAQGMRIDKVFELHEEKTWKDWKNMIIEYHDRFPKTVFYILTNKTFNRSFIHLSHPPYYAPFHKAATIHNVLLFLY